MQKYKLYTYQGSNKVEEDKLKLFYNRCKLSLVSCHGIRSIEQLSTCIWTSKQVKCFQKEILHQGNYRYEFQYYEPSKRSYLISVDYILAGNQRSFFVDL